jgi:hypothetical protein
VGEVTILGRTSDDYLFKQFVARYDVPAYVRRARRVQGALDDLVARCKKQREEWLVMVRVSAKAALVLAGDAADERLRQVGHILELPCASAGAGHVSMRRLARAVRELTESITRFNGRWPRYLNDVDCGPVNRLRDDYNRYYVLEKECALHSARLARLGFQPLLPLTAGELLALMPLLPLPAQPA